MALLSAANQLTMTRGSTRTFLITLSVAGSNPKEPYKYDPDDIEIFFTMRRDYGEDALIHKSSRKSEEIDLVLPKKGQIHLFLLPKDTHHLDPGTYKYDVWGRIISTQERIVLIDVTPFELKDAITRLLL